MSDWWKDPLRFVDAIDLEGVKAEDAHLIANAFFTDRLESRPTEYGVLLRLLRQAMKGYKTELTARQALAVGHAFTAVRIGRQPAHYVAEQLGIDVSNAHKLLHRASTRLKNAILEQKSTDIYITDAQEQVWQPSLTQIREKMSAMRRTCAADGTEGCLHTTRGRYDLCWNCRQVFGTFDNWPGWLFLEARRLRQQHRKDATNALYELYNTGDLADE